MTHPTPLRFCVLLVIGWHCYIGFAADVAHAFQGADQDVPKWIEKLGSAKFSEREQAAKQLEALGPAVLETLRAAVRHQDAEISIQAARLLARMEEKILASNLIAAKKVRLAVKNMSVIEAVNELAKLSDCRLDITGSRTGLSEVKITLDTGEVTFWDALQQLCRKAGLTQSALSNYKDPRKGGNSATTQANQRPSILLTQGEDKEVPVYHHGAVRVRALPGRLTYEGEAHLVIDVSAESRLQQFALVSSPLITKIVDDRGQMLAVSSSDPLGSATDNNGNPVLQRHGGLWIKLGEKKAKSLREVSGQVSVRALNAPEILVRANDILRHPSRSFFGIAGHFIHMSGVEKQEDRSYRIRLAVETPDLQDMRITRDLRWRRGGKFNVNDGKGASYGIRVNMPKMVDIRGKDYQAEIVSQATDLDKNGQVVQIATLVYRPTAEPARLELQGQRLIHFSIPFKLENVSIP